MIAPCPAADGAEGLVLRKADDVGAIQGDGADASEIARCAQAVVVTAVIDVANRLPAWRDHADELAVFVVGVSDRLRGVSRSGDGLRFAHDATVLVVHILGVAGAIGELTQTAFATCAADGGGDAVIGVADGFSGGGGVVGMQVAAVALLMCLTLLARFKLS